jgi:hypothetical protein
VPGNSTVRSLLLGAAIIPLEQREHMVQKAKTLRHVAIRSVLVVVERGKHRTRSPTVTTCFSCSLLAHPLELRRVCCLCCLFVLLMFCP